MLAILQWRASYHHMPIRSLMLTKELLPNHTTVKRHLSKPRANVLGLNMISRATALLTDSQGISTDNWIVGRKQSQDRILVHLDHILTPLAVGKELGYPFHRDGLEHDSAQRASQRVSEQ